MIAPKPLPYRYSDLEPFLSAEQMKAHYEGHYLKYVDRFGKIRGRGETPVSVIVDRDPSDPVFQQGAQVWNHEFFWDGLRPLGRGSEGPPPEVTPELVDAFNEAARTAFGSAWVWIVFDPQHRQLEVVVTKDADNPIRYGKHPLLTLDVWEHAYYLDYTFHRADYIKNFWPHVDWSVFHDRLAHAV